MGFKISGGAKRDFLNRILKEKNREMQGVVWRGKRDKGEGEREGGEENTRGRRSQH